jgi:hypothetical protein
LVPLARHVFVFFIEGSPSEQPQTAQGIQDDLYQSFNLNVGKVNFKGVIYETHIQNLIPDRDHYLVG